MTSRWSITPLNAEIREILFVTGVKNAGDFLRLLGNGKDFGLNHLNYTYQEGEGGIAKALGLAEDFADDDPICVILGDNIIENNICSAVENFKKQKRGAKILLPNGSPANAGFYDLSDLLQLTGLAYIEGKTANRCLSMQLTQFTEYLLPSTCCFRFLQQPLQPVVHLVTARRSCQEKTSDPIKGALYR